MIYYIKTKKINNKKIKIKLLVKSFKTKTKDNLKF